MTLFMTVLTMMAGGLMTTDTPPIQARLSQVAITVTDLETTKRFYSDTIGLPMRYELPTMVIYDLSGVNLLLSLPEEEVEHSPGGFVVYIEVDDIHAVRDAMQQRGARFVDEPHVVHRENGRELWMTFFRDPDDHLLALTSIQLMSVSQ